MECEPSEQHAANVTVVGFRTRSTDPIVPNRRAPTVRGHRSALQPHIGCRRRLPAQGAFLPAIPDTRGNRQLRATRDRVRTDSTTPRASSRRRHEPAVLGTARREYRCRYRTVVEHVRAPTASRRRRLPSGLSGCQRSRHAALDARPIRRYACAGWCTKEHCGELHADSWQATIARWCARILSRRQATLHRPRRT
jgi:hypothetical protein